MSREKDAARREFVSEAEEIIEALSGDGWASRRASRPTP